MVFRFKGSDRGIEIWQENAIKLLDARAFGEVEDAQ